MDRSAHSQARSQSRTPYIPMPKARGFTAIFDKLSLRVTNACHPYEELTDDLSYITKIHVLIAKFSFYSTSTQA